MKIKFGKHDCLAYIEGDVKNIGFSFRLGCKKPNTGYEWRVEPISILWVSLGPIFQSHIFYHDDA
jgi:hypothetical protein